MEDLNIKKLTVRSDFGNEVELELSFQEFGNFSMYDREEYAWLNREEAEKLRDWLTDWLAKAQD